MSERLLDLVAALGGASERLGRTAYMEMRENTRLLGLPVPELWDTLSLDGKTLWENVALAVVHEFIGDLPALLGRKT